jgi:hypothetical protein
MVIIYYILMVEVNNWLFSGKEKGLQFEKLTGTPVYYNCTSLLIVADMTVEKIFYFLFLKALIV